MKLQKTLLLMLAAAALGACSRDDGVTGPVNEGPKALIRFVNAVPDTGAVDFRFVDKLENLPTFLGVAFRGASGGYQRVDPGSRPVRVFLSDTLAQNAVLRLIDTTITLNANSRYTLVYAGNARGNKDRLMVIEEDATHPSPVTGSIAVKAIHAAVGTGAVDLYVGNNATDPLTATIGKVTNVAYAAKSAYATLPVRASGTGNLYTFAVTSSGTTTALFSATPNQPGIPTPAGQIYGAQGGVQVSGSVLTAVIVPAAVAGSQAANSTNTTPSVLLLVDKQLQ